jgi:hypothetical protein
MQRANLGGSIFKMRTPSQMTLLGEGHAGANLI